jgi:hypothetical protein
VRPLSRLTNGIRALFRRGIADEDLDAEVHAFLWQTDCRRLQILIVLILNRTRVMILAHGAVECGTEDARALGAERTE